MAYPASQVIAAGERVTTRSTLGGIGVGYVIRGVVLESGGNGHYYIRPGSEFLRDDGDGYMRVARSLNASLLDGEAWERGAA